MVCEDVSWGFLYHRESTTVHVQVLPKYYAGFLDLRDVVNVLSTEPIIVIFQVGIDVDVVGSRLRSEHSRNNVTPNLPCHIAIQIAHICA